MNPPSGSGTGGKNWLAALSIPMLIMIAPAAGAYAGHLLDERAGSGPWGIGVGSMLGLAAAVVRIRQILKKL